MAGKDSLDQQATDAAFLERRFDIAPDKASELVSRGDIEPDKVRQEAGRKQSDDHLKGVPQPDAPADDRQPDAQEQRLKPVLHHENNRVGGG